jgi:ferredoxin
LTLQYSVIIDDLKKTINLPVNSNLTILEELVDDFVPFRCKVGCCGSCLIKVTKGTKKLSKIKSNETKILKNIGYEDSNYRLACQCKILGDITVEKIDKGIV